MWLGIEKWFFFCNVCSFVASVSVFSFQSYVGVCEIFDRLIDNELAQTIAVYACIHTDGFFQIVSIPWQGEPTKWASWFYAPTFENECRKVKVSFEHFD